MRAGVTLAVGLAVALPGCNDEDDEGSEAPEQVATAPRAQEKPSGQQASGYEGSNKGTGSPGERAGEGADDGSGPAASIPDKALGTYEIDPVHSSFVFRGGHFGLSYVYGLFNEVNGTIELEKKTGESSVDIEVAADSLFSGSRQRDKDLKGPDFLNVSQFPKITFESTKVEKTGDGFRVSGKLGLHGKTKNVAVMMKRVGSGKMPMDESYRTGFHGTFEIKRSNFGMDYMIDGIGDKVRLTAAIEAIKQ